jgi:hypothetical protein
MFSQNGEDFRLAMLRRLLFAGCVTGRRLQAAFGPMCDELVWEETTREIAGDPRTVLPADKTHIIKVLCRFDPPVVIAFGAHAGTALRALFDDIGWSAVHCGVKLLFAPHPAARHRTTPDLLRLAADNVRVYVPNAPALPPQRSGGRQEQIVGPSGSQK